MAKNKCTLPQCRQNKAHVVSHATENIPIPIIAV